MTKQNAVIFEKSLSHLKQAGLPFGLFKCFEDLATLETRNNCCDADKMF